MIQIGRLRAHPATRQIYLDDVEVQIGSRAFDVLLLLVASNGDLVKKEEILKRVWPESIVEENNIHVQVSSLRKLLGDDRGLIQTIPGRGYRLQMGPDATDKVRMQAGSPAVPTNLPASTSPLIGREQAIDDVARTLQTARLLTLVGSGGIGKTRLAIEAARGVLPRFPEGVYVVSLACATSPATVLEAIGKSLGIGPGEGPASLAQIAAKMRQRRMLVVLDNCEHVLESAAQAALVFLQDTGGTHILATSREALRVPGETVYTVPTLDYPEPDDQGDEVLRCSAVRLFLARATASNTGFPTDARSIQETGTVCRRLDGIPLALELAASRAAVLGIQTLSAHLDDRFRMLTGGHRTALPRHQTLKATLDWSYALLDDDEQRLLRWLGMFASGFNMAGIAAVMGAEWREQGKAINALTGLVAKSLVIVDNTTQEGRYRLLETTRAYAIQKLDDNGEYACAARAHAQYLSGLLNTYLDGRAQDVRGPTATSLRKDLNSIRSALVLASLAR
jgi:predicted ATPase/DNA-binding winged helix-turn-helix (wHTH) protein